MVLGGNISECPFGSLEALASFLYLLLLLSTIYLFIILELFLAVASSYAFAYLISYCVLFSTKCHLANLAFLTHIMYF